MLLPVGRSLKRDAAHRTDSLEEHLLRIALRSTVVATVLLRLPVSQELLSTRCAFYRTSLGFRPVLPRSSTVGAKDVLGCDRIEELSAFLTDSYHFNTLFTPPRTGADPVSLQ